MGVSERCASAVSSTLAHPSSSPGIASPSAAQLRSSSTVEGESVVRGRVDKMTEASSSGSKTAPPTSEQQRAQRNSHSSSRKSTTVPSSTTAALLNTSNGDHPSEDIFLEENFEKIEVSFTYIIINNSKIFFFMTLSLLMLQDWLDEHPAFVQNYFLRKVSRSLVDQWLIAHSTSTGTLGKSACASSKHLIFLDHHPLTACKTRRHRHSIAYSQVPSECPYLNTQYQPYTITHQK